MTTKWPAVNNGKFDPKIHVPHSELQLSLSLSGTPYHVHDDLPLVLLIDCFSVNLPAGTRIELNASHFYRRSLVILKTGVSESDSLEVPISLKVAGEGANSTITSLPILVDVKIETATLPRMQYYSEQTGFKFMIHNHIRRIMEWNLPRRIPGGQGNILVFGPAGAGKSTLINFIYTSFLGKIATYAAVGAGQSHVTKSVGQYNLAKVRDFQGIKWKLIDTPGVASDTYSGIIFDGLMKGLLPENIDLVADRPNVQREIVDRKRSLGNECSPSEIHCVLIVLPHNISSDPELLLRMRNFISHLTSTYNLNPLLVVTKVDLVNPNARDQLKPRFSQAVGIPEHNIFLVSNDNAKVMTFEKDRILISILDNSLTMLDNFIRQNKQQYELVNVPSEMLTLEDLDLVTEDVSANYYAL